MEGGDQRNPSHDPSICNGGPPPRGLDTPALVRLALQMIAKCPDIDGAGELLERSAQAASDWAKFQLGSLYMEDVGARSKSGRFRLNRKKSLEHLRLVRGEHLAMANVLVAANLLEQSVDDASLRPLGEAELERARTYLVDEGAKLDAKETDDPEAIARHMQLYEAWRVLAGVARTFNVASMRDFLW